jgi:glycosyltransferase involved in cell wall biosynthesis
MKILCFIDSFGSGGAQRQMVNLACGLKGRGHEVDVFVYHPDDFFRPVIQSAGIRVHEVEKGSGFSPRVLLRLVGLLRKERYDGVISFLNTPNVYSELAVTLAPRTRLIVSERTNHQGDGSRLGALARRLLHGAAERVTANSRSHARWLRRYPWLRNKTSTVYNGFTIDSTTDLTPNGIPPLRLLAVGRIGPEKNAIPLIEALHGFHDKHGYVPPVSWAGRQDERPSGVAYRRQVDAILARYPEVQANWHWIGERTDVPELIAEHRALIHPSLYEGLPNVVCEALIAGRPVLVSDVCDHGFLVEEGKRGFLFDPDDPESIMAAIERLAELSSAQWRALSENARSYAEESLSLDRMAAAYEELLRDSPEA